LNELLKYFSYCSQGFQVTLKVTGYVRGQPLCANSLVHITGWGDFQMPQIYTPNDPHPLEKRRNENRKEVSTRSRNGMKDEGVRILKIAEPAKQV
jgi:pre-rRNA-processing protein TSR1